MIPSAFSAANVAAPSLPVLPGQWLGMLGGGQLGRMAVHAAQSMGYKVCVIDPDPNSPAGSVADKHLQVDYTNEEALGELSRLCKAATTEFENVPAQALDALAAAGVFVAPSSSAVSVAQNRVAEKKFLASCAYETGIPAAPHWIIDHVADVKHAPKNLFPGILKVARMGYDGKGQVPVPSFEALEAAWEELGHVPCVLEKRLDLAFEVSAIVARGHDGAMISYPLSQNVHRNGILHTSTVPAPDVSEDLADQIRSATKIIAHRLNYVGVLCIEFFVLEDGSVVANEMAPRPHNSGHFTMDACLANQFEQQIRAMTGLPLATYHQHSPVVMVNLLGDEWLVPARSADGQPVEPDWENVLAHPWAKLHLYGKSEPRKGRKMGHVNCVAPTLAEAQSAASQVMRVLHLSR